MCAAFCLLSFGARNIPVLLSACCAALKRSLINDWAPGSQSPIALEPSSPPDTAGFLEWARLAHPSTAGKTSNNDEIPAARALLRKIPKPIAKPHQHPQKTASAATRAAVATAAVAAEGAHSHSRRPEQDSSRGIAAVNYAAIITRPGWALPVHRVGTSIGAAWASSERHPADKTSRLPCRAEQTGTTP